MTNQIWDTREKEREKERVTETNRKGEREKEKESELWKNNFSPPKHVIISPGPRK